MGLRVGITNPFSGLTHVVTEATGDHLTVTESELSQYVHADSFAKPETEQNDSEIPSRVNA